MQYRHFRPKDDAKKPIDLRSSSANLIKAFGLIWQAHRPGTIGMATVTLISTPFVALANTQSLNLGMPALPRVPAAERFQVSVRPAPVLASVGRKSTESLE